MKKDWFVEWFNTDEYLNVYKHRNESDAECHIRFLLSKINLTPKASILDLACGSGRHSILLSKLGFNVTGVDLSERLLTEAKNSAEKENLKIEFIQSDIREFSSEKKFDLIVNLFTSFGYFETDKENFLLFQKAYSLLNPNGYFVLDYFNKNHLEKNLIGYSEESNENYIIKQEREIVDQRVNKKITIIRNGNSKVYFESIKLYESNFLILKLKEFGFEIINLFGDFLGNEFDEISSPRFIALCKKNN
ncbi:SAM-dependent methyltransferase [Ignavibacterium album JCM 16511]|uniref:SAM-dependent methyltransferase n=1 Tax=Ignavibacterium album (strain DSM 19864 / JCM 16511 / NBRC 101810 / Mat9-16) TaxID=945713 RepID=I0ALD8_IGNAJ|nr:class I SAM-dependent methyltransferase [Ignavibacterium album]AFH49795.1 SAM-dependent methyltransferase [Ignavibacterium album JCM 16511]